MTDQPGTETLEQYKARLQREISEQAERENKERVAKLEEATRLYVEGCLEGDIEKVRASNRLFEEAGASPGGQLPNGFPPKQPETQPAPTPTDRGPGHGVSARARGPHLS